MNRALEMFIKEFMSNGASPLKFNQGTNAYTKIISNCEAIKWRIYLILFQKILR